jgi:hypothetical protein
VRWGLRDEENEAETTVEGTAQRRTDGRFAQPPTGIVRQTAVAFEFANSPHSPQVTQQKQPYPRCRDEVINHGPKIDGDQQCRYEASR